MCFSKPIGTGWVYADNIDGSISFVAMDMKLEENLTFHRKSNYQNGLIIFFNQIEISQFFEIKSGDDFIVENKKDRNNIYISSTTKDVEFSYSAGSKLRRLGVYLSPQWFRSHSGKNEEMRMHDVIDEHLEKVNAYQLNKEIKESIRQIFELNHEDKACQKPIKTKVLLLLDYLFQSYFYQKQNTAYAIKRRSEDLENLRKVEKMLVTEQLAPYPSISKLTQIALMSGTRLKQRFKEEYGYGIFEFYNKQRLEKAAAMLKKGFPVKQVAHDVGYENASNFTKAFKKQFKITPGQVWDENNRLRKSSDA